MSLIQEREQKIMDSFAQDSHWEDRYRRIIQWGREMDSLHDSKKNDQLLVKGCQSKVWLWSEKKNNQVFFQGDSSALITKGLLSLMIYLYSGSTPLEILQHQPEFIKKLDLLNHLTPSRSSGLGSLVQYMKNYAQAFHLMEKSGHR